MNNIFSYTLVMSTFSDMLNKGLITSLEFKKLEKNSAKKYGLKKGSIFRIYNLINDQNNGNICGKDRL